MPRKSMFKRPRTRRRYKRRRKGSARRRGREQFEYAQSFQIHPPDFDVPSDQWIGLGGNRPTRLPHDNASKQNRINKKNAEKRYQPFFNPSSSRAKPSKFVEYSDSDWQFGGPPPPPPRSQSVGGRPVGSMKQPSAPPASKGWADHVYDQGKQYALQVLDQKKKNVFENAIDHITDLILYGASAALGTRLGTHGGGPRTL